MPPCPWCSRSQRRASIRTVGRVATQDGLHARGGCHDAGVAAHTSGQNIRGRRCWNCCDQQDASGYCLGAPEGNGDRSGADWHYEKFERGSQSDIEPDRPDIVGSGSDQRAVSNEDAAKKVAQDLAVELSSPTTTSSSWLGSSPVHGMASFRTSTSSIFCGLPGRSRRLVAGTSSRAALK